MRMTTAASTAEHLIRIEGMHCGGCEARVKAAIEAVPGVQAAHVSRGAQLARLRADSDLSLPSILAAIETTGYRAAPWPAAE